jgi:hypothetical protein
MEGMDEPTAVTLLSEIGLDLGGIGLGVGEHVRGDSAVTATLAEQFLGRPPVVERARTPIDEILLALGGLAQVIIGRLRVSARDETLTFDTMEERRNET